MRLNARIAMRSGGRTVRRRTAGVGASVHMNAGAAIRRGERTVRRRTAGVGARVTMKTLNGPANFAVKNFTRAVMRWNAKAFAAVADVEEAAVLVVFITNLRTLTSS